MLCIEVITADDSMSEMLEKVSDYVGMGVPAIWLIDPRRRTLSTADADGIHAANELRIPGMTEGLTVERIFAELDALRLTE